MFQTDYTMPQIFRNVKLRGLDEYSLRVCHRPIAIARTRVHARDRLPLWGMGAMVYILRGFKNLRCKTV